MNFVSNTRLVQMTTASFPNSPYNKEGEILVHFTKCQMPRVVDMTKLSVSMHRTVSM